MRAKTIMIQGTSSSAGKSLMATALCRIFTRRGYSVAPFKSQNMSLNSYVTHEGHEMGRAQVTQARAAGVEPSSLMNPVLLKPTTDRKSQIIVRGEVRAVMDAKHYFAWKSALRPEIENAFFELASSYDIIVLEGAGSPAEINLLEGDFVNMGMADIANAPVLLVGDIDRGGVFAALYGTIMLLPKNHRRRIKGMIINKFRGDVSILKPGIEQLEKMTGIPVLGIIPFEPFAIDDEDSLSPRLSATSHKADTSIIHIMVPRLPRISNFTDFAVFDSMPGCELHYVTEANQLDFADLIIIPGSKSTVSDLQYLQSAGFAEKICQLSQQGIPVMGICGGFQMLGTAISDPLGIESTCVQCNGLGLLDMQTVFEAKKHTTETMHTLQNCGGFLKGTENIPLSGYEIHMGKSTGKSPALIDTTPKKENTRLNFLAQENASTKSTNPKADTSLSLPSGLASAMRADGMVFGTYLHGIFDNLHFTEKVLQNVQELKLQRAAAQQKLHSYADKSTPLSQEGQTDFSPTPGSDYSSLGNTDETNQAYSHYQQIQEREYDRLADLVEQHLNMDAILSIMGIKA